MEEVEKKSNTSEDDNQSMTVDAVKGLVSHEGLKANEHDPTVRWMSVSQTQKYFAVGTDSGFEIIQNDSTMSIKKLKKNYVFSQTVLMIEMMYKSNFIAIVFEKEKDKVISMCIVGKNASKLRWADTVING